MADETTTDATTEVAPAADAPEVAPTSVEPVAVDDSPVTSDANIGVAEAQTFGPPNPPASSAPVEETFVTTDKVITDHTDPLGTRFQFLGASGPSPLPLAGANGDVRTPEQKLAS